MTTPPIKMAVQPSATQHTFTSNRSCQKTSAAIRYLTIVSYYTQYKCSVYHSIGRQVFGKFDDGKVSFSDGFSDPVFADLLNRFRSPCSCCPCLTTASAARWLSEKHSLLKPVKIISSSSGNEHIHLPLGQTNKKVLEREYTILLLICKLLIQAISNHIWNRAEFSQLSWVGYRT